MSGHTNNFGRGRPRFRGREIARGVLAIAVALLPLSRAPALTIHDAEARALSANPALRAAQLEALAAHERARQAWTRHLGEGDLVAIASRYEGARLVRPLRGPITPTTMASLPFDRDQLHYGATWQIPLFAGGALLAGDEAARLTAQAARDQFAHSAEEIRFAVRSAFRTVLTFQRALEAATAYVRALEQDERSAKVKIATESWSSADAAKVTFALESGRAGRAALAAQRRTALARLAALMGEDGGTEYEVEETGGSPPDLNAIGIAELAVTAATRRHDLAAARASAQALSKRADVVRAGFLPQVAFSGGYFWNGGRSVGMAENTYELTVQLKIPLFGAIGRTFAAREADAAAGQAAERERGKALEIRAQVVDASNRIDAAGAAYEAGKAQRALGAEVARVEKLKLDAGRGKVEDYLMARAQELVGETAYWQGRYAVQDAHDYAALVTATGGTP